jgi:uncharacterized cupin superfamily protein
VSVIRRKDITPVSSDEGGYPAPFDEATGRFRYWPLSDAGGLSQFGAAYEVLEPGPGPSLHHWHEQEDEFLYLIEGEVTVIEGEGDDETRSVLTPGDAVAWPAGLARGHSLYNHTDRPCAYLIIGSRTPTETGHYPGRDIRFTRDAQGARHTHLDGTPYPKRQAAGSDRKD